MMPQRRYPVSTDVPMGDEHSMRQLEMSVLTQIRDSIALMNSDLRKHGDKLDHVNNSVVSLLSARYDEQIAEARRLAEKEQEELKRRFENETADAREERGQLRTQIIEQGKMLSRLGLGMAIAGAAGTAALTAVIGLVVVIIFGGRHG